MIQLVMCDDDQLFLDHYKKILDQIISDEQIDDLTCSDFSSAEELLKNSKLISNLDIVILDHYMKGMQGMEAAKLIRMKNKKTNIIFLSNSPDFVFDSFEVQPKNYILKEKIDEVEFITLIKDIYTEAIKRKGTNKLYLCNQFNGKIAIKMSDIIAFEIVSRKTIVYTTHGQYSCYEAIQKLCDSYCDAGFVKVNRSCLVNMNYIVKIGATEVYMSHDLVFQLTIKLATKVRNEFQNYLIPNA